MRLVRRISTKQNGWKTGPVYSEDDGRTWFNDKGEWINADDIRDDCTAGELIGFFLAICATAWIVRLIFG